MARINIPFIVKQQRITQPTRETIVAGGQNYFYAVFTLCDKWEGIENLKAVFVRENINKLINLKITDNGYECVIPWEVMADKGSFQVGIFGGDKLLTDYAYVIVKQGCVTDGEVPKAPTPDWFTEIEDEVNKVKESTEQIEDLSLSVAEVSSQTEVIKSDVEGIQKQIQEEAHFRGYLSTNAKIQSLEVTPNDFAYSAESGTKWIYDEADGWKDTGTPVPDQLTPASNTTPLMNGEASAGQEEAYARGDHRHPTDRTRIAVTEFNSFKSEVETGFEEVDQRLSKTEVLIIEYGDIESLDFEIEPNAAIYCGIISNSVIATLDVPVAFGFTSALYLTTPSEIPANYSQFPADVYFKGDSTDNGAFVPEANMRYTIVFDFDGYMLNGYVSGVTTV